MDERLLRYLKGKVKVTQNNLIETTHQQIANDLDTSRVVVSRLLKNLENKNGVELGRNSIHVLSNQNPICNKSYCSNDFRALPLPEILKIWMHFKL